VFTWSPQFETGFQTRKVLKNVGDHPIVERYNEKVREEIIGELGDMCWNAIDVVRIGYDIEGSAHYPIILWISVQPNSTTASAHQTAVNCTTILQKHDIHDVECEMREAEIFDLAGPRLLRFELEDSCLDQ